MSDQDRPSAMDQYLNFRSQVGSPLMTTHDQAPSPAPAPSRPPSSTATPGSAGLPDEGKASLDGLGAVLNKSDDLQKRLRALLQATDDFFKPDDDACYAGPGPTTDSAQMSQQWQTMATDSFEGEVLQSDQVVVARASVAPQRRSYHQRPTLEAVHEGLHEDGTPSPPSRSPASAESVMAVHRQPISTHFENVSMFSPLSIALSPLEPTSQFPLPAPMRTEADEVLHAAPRPGFGVCPREVLESQLQHVDSCECKEGVEAGGPRGVDSTKDLRRVLQSMLENTENIFDACFKSASAKLRQFQTRLLEADAMTQKASLSLARATEKQADRAKTRIHGSPGGGMMLAPTDDLSSSLLAAQTLVEDWSNVQKEMLHTVDEHARHKTALAEAAAARMLLRVAELRSYVGRETIHKSAMDKMLSEIEQSLDVANQEKHQLYFENQQLRSHIESLSPAAREEDVAGTASLRGEFDKTRAECAKLRETNSQLTRKLSASLKNKMELEKVQAQNEQLQLKIDSLGVQLEASKQQQQALEGKMEELTSDLERSEAQRERLLEEATRAQVQIQTVEAMRAELMSRSDSLENAQLEMDAKKLQAESLLAELQARERERLAEQQHERELERGRKEEEALREQQREEEGALRREAAAEREQLMRENQKLSDVQAVLKTSVEQKSAQLQSAESRQHKLLAEVQDMESRLQAMQEQQEAQMMQQHDMQHDRSRLQNLLEEAEAQGSAASAQVVLLQGRVQELEEQHELLAGQMKKQGNEQQAELLVRLRELEEAERINAQVYTEEHSKLLERALTAEKRVRELEVSLEAFVNEIENAKKPEEQLLDLRRQISELKAGAELALQKDRDRETERKSEAVEAEQLRAQLAMLQDDFCNASKQQLDESSNVIALKRQVASLEQELVAKETLLYAAKSEEAMSKEEVAALHVRMRQMQAQPDQLQAEQEIESLRHARASEKPDELALLRDDKAALQEALLHAHADINTYKLLVSNHRSAHGQDPAAAAPSPPPHSLGKSPRMATVTATTGFEEAARSGVDQLWGNYSGVGMAPSAVISPLSLASTHSNAGSARLRKGQGGAAVGNAANPVPPLRLDSLGKNLVSM